MTDPVWGTYSVTEPVLADLIASAPVQRLRGIHQAGASYYLFPEKRPLTRFEHSLGVMRFLQLVGASLEEQIAGLLHDVPHTAFSHTVDTLFPNDEHNFHEQHQREVVMASEIPDILRRYRTPLKPAIEPHEYLLLERALPDLCADRIDYTLRDMTVIAPIPREDIDNFLRHLLSTSQGLTTDDTEAALWFARLFADANGRMYTSLDDAGAYWALAGAIRRAFETGHFTMEDLFSTDAQAMTALHASGDPLVEAYLSLLRPGTRFYTVPPGANHFFVTTMKQRRIDPGVWLPGAGGPERLSALSPRYAVQLQQIPEGGTVSYKLWTDSMPDLLIRECTGAYTPLEST